MLLKPLRAPDLILGCCMKTSLMISLHFCTSLSLNAQRQLLVHSFSTGLSEDRSRRHQSPSKGPLLLAPDNS